MTYHRWCRSCISFCTIFAFGFISSIFTGKCFKIRPTISSRFHHFSFLWCININFNLTRRWGVRYTLIWSSSFTSLTSILCPLYKSETNNKNNNQQSYKDQASQSPNCPRPSALLQLTSKPTIKSNARAQGVGTTTKSVHESWEMTDDNSLRRFD